MRREPTTKSNGFDVRDWLKEARGTVRHLWFLGLCAQAQPFLHHARTKAPVNGLDLFHVQYCSLSGAFDANVSIASWRTAALSGWSSAVAMPSNPQTKRATTSPAPRATTRKPCS